MKCYHCGKKLSKKLGYYGLHTREYIKRVLFWKEVGHVCRECVSSGKPTSLK